MCVLVVYQIAVRVLTVLASVGDCCVRSFCMPEAAVLDNLCPALYRLLHPMPPPPGRGTHPGLWDRSIGPAVLSLTYL